MIRAPIFMLLFFALVGCVETAPSPAKTNNPGTSAAQTAKPADDEPMKGKSPQRKTIVTLTDAAAAKVRELQKESGKSYLRVAVKTGGSTGFMYDLQFDDHANVDEDYLDESRELKILVDRRSALFVQDASIDWQVTADGREGFYFDNPNAVQE